MIFDRIENFAHYFEGLEGLSDYLASLTADVKDGRHELDENNIFMNIMRYDTRPRAKCSLEAHQTYVDIQFVLSGTEVIEWFALEGLKADTVYSAEHDVTFYNPPEPSGTRVTLTPGTFVVFFPHDAHMPQIAASDKPETLVKGVIKIKATLL